MAKDGLQLIKEVESLASYFFFLFLSSSPTIAMVSIMRNIGTSFKQHCSLFHMASWAVRMKLATLILFRLQLQ